MPGHKRSRFVALTTLLRRRFPEIPEPEGLIVQGLVLVDGAPALNPRMQVRADASLRVLRPKPLRGTVKLTHALQALRVDARGLVAADIGASAGGFTQALLDAGAARVYAVDAGVGQLRGRLRTDPRVVNLERVNLADLGRGSIPEPLDLLTMDLSYLALEDAVPQLDRLARAETVTLVALVKPTFELRSARLASRPEDVEEAVVVAEAALLRGGWSLKGRCRSPIPGSRGAVEVFVAAVR